MKKITALFITIFTFSLTVFSGNEDNKYSNEYFEKISGNFLEGKLEFENPVMVDIDKDGDFDALKFDNGNVEYYKNTGSNDLPVFILENKNYEKYSQALFVEPKMPYPLFFADQDGDGDLDLFAVKDKQFSNVKQQYEYNVSGAENTLGLDTGTLITIILVLVIVLLLLAILR